MRNGWSSSKSLRCARLGLWLAALTRVCGAAADKPAVAPEPTLLTPVTVLGSHIRRTDFEGPSAVGHCDRDYIDASGALRLADFLNLLPQNYTGSGRGSAPNDVNPETRSAVRGPARLLRRAGPSRLPGRLRSRRAALRPRFPAQLGLPRRRPGAHRPPRRRHRRAARHLTE